MSRRSTRITAGTEGGGEQPLSRFEAMGQNAKLAITDKSNELKGLFADGADWMKNKFDQANEWQKANPEEAGMMGKSFEDMLLRKQQGDLNAVDAVASPWTGNKVGGDFSKGLGGFDPLSDMQEGKALKKMAKERDRMRELRESYGSAQVKGAGISNDKLQEELNAMKRK